MAWGQSAIVALACLLAPVAASAEDDGDAASLVATELGSGMASYFSREMAGQRTASGETCDPDTLTAAHRTAPFGSRMLVTSIDTGRSVVVRINDRGPFSRGRIIDLSRAAADALALTARGHGQVKLQLLAAR